MEVTLFLLAAGYLLAILLGIAGAIIWSSRHGYGRAKTAATILAVLFVLYAIPFGDHTIGMIRFKQLCKEQGGERIEQVVPNVDGVGWETGRQSPPYTTYGYSYFEVKTAKGEIYRYTRRDDGVTAEEKVNIARARYLARGYPYKSISKHYKVSKFVILQASDDKILASHGTVAYSGGWLLGNLGGGSVCPYPYKFHASKFIQDVLKPRGQRE